MNSRTKAIHKFITVSYTFPSQTSDPAFIHGSAGLNNPNDTIGSTLNQFHETFAILLKPFAGFTAITLQIFVKKNH
jgi:hypothetical protein